MNLNCFSYSNDMRLLYINPPKNPKISYKENIMPLSLLYLSAITSKLCETKILDLKVTTDCSTVEGTTLFDKINLALKDFAPTIIGITCFFSGEIKSVLEIATFIKQVSPKTTIMVGGMHPTLFAADIIRNCLNIDIVIIGEGESTTCKILNAICAGKDFSGIDGIAYRKNGNTPILTAYDSDGQIIDCIATCCICDIPKTTYIDDISELPMPAYELIHFNEYTSDTSKWYNPKDVPIQGLSVPLLTSRSCPNCCSFCSMNQVMGLRYRARTAQSVIDEMAYLYDQYNVRYFSIMDDNFTLNKKRTIQICNAIVSRNMKIAIECSSGLYVNSLDDEVIDALASAGLIMTAVAIESGSDYIRNKVVGKNLRKEKINDVVASFNRHPEIYLYGFFIIGFPEDTERTISDTIEMIQALDLDDISVNPLIPLPGTRLFEQCKRENLFVRAIDYKNLWKDEGLFCSPHVNQFYIKPYSLSIQQLSEYHTLFKKLKTEKRIAAKARGKCLGSFG